MSLTNRRKSFTSFSIFPKLPLVFNEIKFIAFPAMMESPGLSEYLANSTLNCFRSFETYFHPLSLLCSLKTFLKETFNLIILAGPMPSFLTWTHIFSGEAKL